ncbi:MAG TPA: rhomboid family intramembrane serine protease [Burkholderiaceae bacterium]|jgi:membrane associated rhomboid family serine protease|nr:rhomboid family intramembrane serine protease [Burkholderiaceae bacterium]
MFSLPPVTQALILANAIVFLLQGLLGAALVIPFALWPLGPNFMPWQPITYAFLHGSLMHLLFNMFGVFMFGSDVERVWGSRPFLVYYVACALSAAATQLIVTGITGTVYPTVGASGALFGLLLAFAMLFPHRTVMLIFPPIPLRAPVFVTLYGALELVLGVSGAATGIAHFAHLGGLVGGWLMIRYWRGWR